MSADLTPFEACVLAEFQAHPLRAFSGHDLAVRLDTPREACWAALLRLEAALHLRAWILAPPEVPEGTAPRRMYALRRA